MIKKHNFKILNYILIFICSIIITGAIWYFLGNKISSVFSYNGTCYTECQNKVTITDKGISDAVSKIYDAVFIIENYQNDKLSSTGTGFIYKVDNKNGYILTNYHVINGASKITVISSSDEEITATYLGGDEYLDIAVLTIPKNKVKIVAQLGNSEDSKLGDTVFTIGTPVDYEYRGTVTRGILSGKERLVEIQTTAGNYITKVLQTDAAINPGNSGGPLVNINGEVIGINSLKFVNDEIEGMGFAIAIEDVTSHLDTLEKGEKIVRPLLGVSMIDIKETLRLKMQGISVSSNIKYGVVIEDVVSNTNSSKIFEKGDIITKVNNNIVKTSAYLRYELYKYNIGDTVTITYIRDENEKEAKIKLVAQN